MTHLQYASKVRVKQGINETLIVKIDGKRKFKSCTDNYFEVILEIESNIIVKQQ